MGITLISCSHFILLPLFPCSGFIIVDNTMSPCRIYLLDRFIITLTVDMKFHFVILGRNFYSLVFLWFFYFQLRPTAVYTLRSSLSDDTVAAHE